ncbi:MAG: AI-2E family transporter [Planctomycetes bacterium]|nr:AI-2E family transporter [Planctomycetota bacterium]MBI3844833.1 AI-2E family transporter [Planctomycetota bacterium]
MNGTKGPPNLPTDELPRGEDALDAPPSLPAPTTVNESRGSRVILLWLFVLALVYTITFTRVLLLPILFALLLTEMLAPFVRSLRRAHVPEPVGAAFVVLVLLGALGFGIYRLTDPAMEWMHKLPGSISRIEQKLEGLKKPVEEISQATEHVQRIGAIKSDAGEPTEQNVVVKDPSLLSLLFSGTQQFLIGLLIVLILLYFLLASGDHFLRKLVGILPTLRDKKTAVEVARQLEQDISRYLFTITMVNTCLGIVIALAMFACGMPNPVLWGVMIGVLNFIPYIGAVTTGVVIALVSTLTFDELGRAVVAPLVFTAIVVLEGYVITPTILGVRLMMNPVVIFIWLLIWGAMWGIPGTLIAVPLLAAFKILCDKFESLAPIAEFIGR